MELRQLVRNTLQNIDAVADAARIGNFRVLGSLAGPALRGLIFQKGKAGDACDVPANYSTHFEWKYERNHGDMSKLYNLAKKSQWDSDTALDWATEVDPYNEELDLAPDVLLPLTGLRTYRRLPKRDQQQQRYALMSWVLSQFLHGEQGALMAACQVTEAVHWMDGKLYGSTQVVDEGRHVEVFHRYLTQKLGKMYQINDNLYVLIDALITGSAWDLKFLGMQIMIEGVALGAFGTIHATTKEPLLKKLLQYVITDEARHVHFGVISLRDYYADASPAFRRDREDWAYEMALLMRNRFLAHEFYEEYYGHIMSRRAWNQFVLNSEFMNTFRRTTFRRIIPNLKRIHLLSDRIRPHYAALGLLQWEHERAAPDLTAQDLLSDN